MKTARMAIDEQAHDADPDAAEDHLAEGDVEHRHAAGQRREAVVDALTAPHRRVGRDRRPEDRVGDAEAHLLALHVAAGLRRGAACRSRPSLVRIGLPFCSLAYITATLMSTITMAAANSAHPCRWLPANRPNV